MRRPQQPGANSMNRGAGALRARMEKIAVPRSAPKPQRAKRQGGDGRLESASIANFQPVSAPRSMAQEDTLDFLASVHASCDESRDKRHYDALFNKFGCSSSRVKQREYFAEEVLDMPGSLPNLEARQNVHSKHAKHIFNDAFLANELPPDAIFHVTCTGYESPTPAQIAASQRGWTDTKHLNLYHMGCYAAVPAVETCKAYLSTPHYNRISVVHTELTTLHMHGGTSDPEQVVVQSLFADGALRYDIATGPAMSPGMEILGVKEEIVPQSTHAMTWKPTNVAFRMTLDKEVPTLLMENLESGFAKLLDKARIDIDEEDNVVYAIHPGGPKIVDMAQESLGCADHQVKHSKEVLSSNGNMSSATLPSIWRRMLMDKETVPDQSLILSAAFGPGLTLAMVALRKHA